MPYEDFKERLAMIKSKWEQNTADRESMTPEAKKQCLDELEDVCKCLGGLKEGLVKASKAEQEAEAKAEMLKVVESKKAMLKLNYLEIRGMGAGFNKDGPFSIYGYFPEFWVDMQEHLVKIEAEKKQLAELEAELKKFDPTGKCFFGRGGGFVVADPVIPPPTDFLLELLGFSRNENEYKSRVITSVNQIGCQISLRRKNLHRLLIGFKPVDLKTLQPKLDKLNKEREDLIYSLRVLECQGHFSGFCPVVE
jgi:hypothetical protein